MVSIIQSKKSSGTLKLYVDYRSGTSNDFSGNDNHGTFSGDPYFNRDGIYFDGNNDYTNHGDPVELDFGTSDFTIVFTIKTRTTAANDVVSKRNGVGNTLGFMCSVTATGEIFTEIDDGAGNEVNLTSAGTVNDGTIHTATFAYDRSGSVTCYIDGLLDANSAVISSVGTISNAVNFLIGVNGNGTRDYKDNVLAVAAFSELLTATEIAQVTSELEEQTWPKMPVKQSASSLAPATGVDPVASWEMKPTGDILPDLVGNNPGTIFGSLIHSKSLQGNAMYFPGVAGNNVRVTSSAGVNVTTGDFTLTCWVRTTSASAIMRLMDKKTAVLDPNGVGYTIGINASGQLIGGIGDGTAFISDETVLNTVAIDDGLWHFVVAQFDRSSTVTGFVDDTSTGGTSISAVTGTLTNATNLRIGEASDAQTEPFTGELLYPTLFKRRLTTNDRQNLFNQGIESLPFKTDWGVTQSPANVTAGFMENSPFIVSTGAYKIGVSTINSNPVKVIQNVTAGLAYATVNVGVSATEAAYGQWEWYMKKGADGNAIFIQFIADTIGNISATGQDGYNVKVDANESFLIQKSVNGSASTIYQTAGGYINNNQWYKIRITRTFSNVFTVYVDDVLAPASGASGTNPFTDSSTTAGQYFIVDLDAADMVAYSNLTGNFGVKTSSTISVGGIASA